MFIRMIRYSLLAAAVLLITGAGKAQAQFFGTPYGFGYGSSIYANERLPFYSLYPPVYYKQAIPRSYGYSPFAYPLGSPTPTPSSVSQLLPNPFYAAPAPAPAPDDSELADRPKPLIIRNPFVPDAAAALTSTGVPAPSAEKLIWTRQANLATPIATPYFPPLRGSAYGTHSRSSSLSVRSIAVIAASR